MSIGLLNMHILFFISRILFRLFILIKQIFRLYPYYLHNLLSSILFNNFCSFFSLCISSNISGIFIFKTFSVQFSLVKYIIFLFILLSVLFICVLLFGYVLFIFNSFVLLDFFFFILVFLFLFLYLLFFSFLIHS